MTTAKTVNKGLSVVPDFEEGPILTRGPTESLLVFRFSPLSVLLGLFACTFGEPSPSCRSHSALRFEGFSYPTVFLGSYSEI